MRILCKIIAGSHLFGTNTPTSDTDYKGVFVPDADDILMSTYKHTVVEHTNTKHNTKNTSEDIDIEMYSLKKFFDMLYIANNHALEILFAPDEMILETSPEWEFIRSYKENLVCKKVDTYIEYCNSQAAKYGVKGSRVNSVVKAIQCLERYDFDCKLKNIWGLMKKELEGTEHIYFHPQSKLQPVPYVEINTRKFQDTVNVCNTLLALKKIHNNYGNRAKQAANNEGIDWKAISHAYRVGVQAYELLETGKITLPIAEDVREYIKRLKNNTHNLTITFDEVRPILENLADNLITSVEKSTLREELEVDEWAKFVKRIYANVILERY